MTHKSDRTLLGRLNGIDNWSDPIIWFDPLHQSTAPGVPTSSGGLNVHLDVSSTVDLGTARKPFQTNDLIGVNDGLGQPPALTVSGFLYAHSVQNLSYLGVGESGGYAMIDGNVSSVGWIDVHEQGVLNVRGNMGSVGQVTVSTGATLELGGTAGSATFGFGIGPSKLIIDHPGGKSFQNLISFDPNATLELGHMQFDAATFMPKSAGSFAGSLKLTEHGKQVYSLANVTQIPTPGFGFSVGHDKTTGFDFVSYHSA